MGQHGQGLFLHVFKGWTWAWTLSQRLSMDVKHAVWLSQAVKAPLVWRMMAEMSVWPGSLSVSVPQIHQGKCPVLTVGESSPGWLETPFVPHHCLKHCPGPWKAGLMGTQYTRNNQVRQWYSFPKQPHRPLGQRTWHWVGISHSLSCTSLWKDQMMQWMVKDYNESSGWWDLQTLGCTFREGHLVS